MVTTECMLRSQKRLMKPLVYASKLISQVHTITPLYASPHYMVMMNNALFLVNHSFCHSLLYLSLQVILADHVLLSFN